MRELKIVPTKTQKRGMRVRVPGNSSLTRFFLGPVGRILIMGSALFMILLMGAFHLFLRPLFQGDRRKAARRPVCQQRQDFRRPGIGGRGRCADAPTTSPRNCAAAAIPNRATTPSAPSAPPQRNHHLSRARIPISTRKPASSSSPAGGFRRSSPCRTTPRAASTSWNRSSSPTFPAPAARSAAW